MDYTAHAAAANGLDILLWLAFLYLVPRLLRFRPQVRVRQPRPELRRLAHLASDEAALKIA